MTFILIAVAFIGGIVTGWYVGKNGWAALGGAVVAALAVAWDYVSGLF